MRYVYEKYAQATSNAKGEIENITLHVPESFNFGFDVVDYIGSTEPDRRAMVWVSKNLESKVFTFGDMMRQSARAANYLKSLGVKKGDKVMLILKRHYQFWFTIVALHKLGAVVIPATHQLLGKDIAYRVNKAGISCIVCTQDDQTPEHVEEVLDQMPSLKVRCVVNGARAGWEDFDAGMAACSDVYPRPTGEDDPKATEPMIMYFTSGTTGYPKVAVHDHGYAIAHIVTARWWHNVDPDGIHLTVADTGWGKAVWGKLYGQWFCHACVFTYDFDRFEAEKMLPMFAQYGITSFCAPPTIYRFLIKDDLSRFDLSSLKYCTVAGEALNPEVFNAFYEATGVKLMEGFGQTETTLVAANLVGTTPKPGSMGKPNPCYDVVILDEDDHPVAPGKIGELCIRTSETIPTGLFNGYFEDEDRTRDAWHDGYYRTGDTAWMDEDGYLWYEGRADDVIKSSGYRIGPFEVESVIMELPYVLECAITGVPDPVRGTVVKATIVLVKGTEPSDALKKEVQTYVKTHTAPYKYPRVVEFVDALPKTISGKIRRVELREQK